MFHSLAELALLLIAAVYWIACEYIDTRGRLEFIEKSHPRIWRLVNNRPVRLAGILFVWFCYCEIFAMQWSYRLHRQLR